ncbi:MAG: hypothetical protein Q7T70_18765 [Polaromonas sp.]|nr:hypothetical protein [Polaromonas sp.]
MWLAETGFPLMKEKASRVEAFFYAAGLKCHVETPPSRSSSGVTFNNLQ